VRSAALTHDFIPAKEFCTDRSCNVGGFSYLNLNGG